MRSSIVLFAFLQMLTCCSLATQQCPSFVEISSSSQPNLEIYDCNIGSSQQEGLLVIDSRENPPFLPSSSSPSLSNSSHPPTLGTISVSLYRGLVWPSSLISILLPNSTAYSTVSALQITIADSTFKGGGGVQISGSLPPNSVLRITNNTFELDAIAKPAWFVDVLAGVAYIAVPDDYLSYLGNMSLVEVSKNVFIGIGRLSSGFSTVGFSWRGSGVYREGASVILSKNYFSLSCEGTLDPIFDQRACVVGMHIVANQYFNENGSSLTVDGNTFDIFGGFIAALPPIEVSGALGSTASFSHNSARADTRGAVGSYALSVGSFVTGDNMLPQQSDFRFGMINNTLNVTGNSACAVGFGPTIPTDLIFGPPETGLIALVSYSRMLFDSNMLSSEGCDIQVIMERPITLSDQAQISIFNNNFNRTDETQIETAAIVLTHTFSVPTSITLSLFTVFGNRWFANNTIPAPEGGNTKQLFGTLNFQEVVVSAPNGSIQACSNLFYGINVQGSGETVRLLSTPAIAEVIRTDACIDVIETTEYASSVSEYEPTSTATPPTSTSTATPSTSSSTATPPTSTSTAATPSTSTSTATPSTSSSTAATPSTSTSTATPSTSSSTATPPTSTSTATPSTSTSTATPSTSTSTATPSTSTSTATPSTSSSTATPPTSTSTATPPTSTSTATPSTSTSTATPSTSTSTATPSTSSSTATPSTSSSTATPPTSTSSTGVCCICICTSDTTPKRDMDTKFPTVFPSCAAVRNFSITIAFLLASFVFFM